MAPNAPLLCPTEQRPLGDGKFSQRDGKGNDAESLSSGESDSGCFSSQDAESDDSASSEIAKKKLAIELDSRTECQSPGLSTSFKRLSTQSSDRHSSSPYARNAKFEQQPESKQPKQQAKQEKQQVKQEQQQLSAGPTSPQKTQDNLVNFISNVVSVTNYMVGFECVDHAQRLSELVVVMTKRHKLYDFLQVFGHSVVCTKDGDGENCSSKERCSNTCRMFRRTRVHVANANHPCAVMQVYSQLLRLHIDSCLDDKCGLSNCKGMLAMRQNQGNAVLPRNFQLMEQKVATKLSVTIRPTVPVIMEAPVKEEAGQKSEPITGTVKHEPDEVDMTSVTMDDPSRIINLVQRPLLGYVALPVGEMPPFMECKKISVEIIGDSSEMINLVQGPSSRYSTVLTEEKPIMTEGIMDLSLKKISVERMHSAIEACG